MRLAFIKIMMNPGNLLLLDEPTTHLDIDSKEILLRALKNIEATIVFVSHDSHFINELATSVVYFRGRGDIINYPGTYKEYLDYYGHDIIAMEKEEEKEEDKKVVEKVSSKGKNDYKQQKKIRNKLNKLKKECEELESAIDKAEAEKSQQTKNSSLPALMKEWESKKLELETLLEEAGE